MKKRALLSIIFASTLSLCACDFDIMSIFTGQEDIEELLRIPEEKRKELIDSVENIATKGYMCLSYSSEKKYINLSPDSYKQTILDKNETFNGSVYYPLDNKLLQGYGESITTYQIVDNDFYIDGSLVPEDSMYYVFRMVIETCRQTYQTEYFTFGSIDKMLSVQEEMVKQYDDTYTSTFTKDDFLKASKVINKKDKGTFSIVCDKAFYLRVAGYDCYLKYMKYEYKDYMLVSQTYYEYMDTVDSNGNVKGFAEILSYAEYSYNVNPDAFFNS